jgi:hypothetical protein
LLRKSLKQLFSGIYKLCECGCGKLIPFINKNNKPSKYFHGHNLGKKENHNNWKGGRYQATDDYWMILMPGYYRSNVRGYVPEHVYFYEQHYKCCILKWGEVHHLDLDKNNNKISNLQGMMDREHTRLHKRINTDGRFCFNCGSKETYTRKNGSRVWHFDLEGNILCNKCGCKYRRENP